MNGKGIIVRMWKPLFILGLAGGSFFAGTRVSSKPTQPSAVAVSLAAHQAPLTPEEQAKQKLRAWEGFDYLHDSQKPERFRSAYIRLSNEQFRAKESKREADEKDAKIYRSLRRAEMRRRAAEEEEKNDDFMRSMGGSRPSGYRGNSRSSALENSRIDVMNFENQ